MDFTDRRYINLIEPHLEIFRERGEDFNFRCPFCGDSEKSSSKARGWLRWNKEGRRYRYNCFNCSTHHSTLVDLIRQVKPSIADAYVADKFKNSNKRIEDDRAIRSILTAKPIFNVRAEVNAPIEPVEPAAEQPSLGDIPIPRPMPRFPKVERALETEWALEYLASRKVPFDELEHVFAVDNLVEVTRHVEAYADMRIKGRAILFPYYNPDGRLGYVQARTMYGGLRYLTLELQGGEKMWGRHRVDPNAHIYVFEGAMDAICVKNAVASGGVDLIRAAALVKAEFPSATVSLCYDSDFSTNPEVYGQVVRAVKLDFGITIAKGPGKDVNEMLTGGGWTTEQVETMLRERTYFGLRAKLEISQTRKPWKHKSSTPAAPSSR